MRCLKFLFFSSLHVLSASPLGRYSTSLLNDAFDVIQEQFLSKNVKFESTRKDQPFDVQEPIEVESIEGDMIQSDKQQLYTAEQEEQTSEQENYLHALELLEADERFKELKSELAKTVIELRDIKQELKAFEKIDTEEL